MRILLVIPALGAVYGGPSRVALSLAAAVARQGGQVDLVTTDADGPNRIVAPLGRWIEQDGFRLCYFPRGFGGEFKGSLPLLGWLLRHAREYDVAHVHSDFNFPVLAAALACRACRVPYLLTPHGMLEPWALDYKAGKKKFYFQWVEHPLVLRAAAAIHALNGSEAANIDRLRLGPPTVVLPNGIDADEAQRRADPAEIETFFDLCPAARGRTVILFLHRVDPKKGLDLLAEAYAGVRRRFPGTHLVVAGPETVGFGATARGYFTAAGIETDAVTFTGMVSGGIRRGALAAASVFVTPSYSEGFSMSVLEAMAAGLPCVITTACNFPEAATAQAAYVTPAEAGPFAGALESVLADPPAAHAMGDRARKMVLADYTWDHVAAGAVQVYGRLATPSKS